MTAALWGGALATDAGDETGCEPHAASVMHAAASIARFP